MTKEGFSTWFKETFYKEDCLNNAVFTRQSLMDAWDNGYNKAKEEWKKHFMQCSSPFCLDIFSSVKCYGELGNMAKKEGEEK